MNEACEIENNVIVFVAKICAKIDIRKKNGGQ